MTPVPERLLELRRHLDHLKGLRPRATVAALRSDLSLHNDVLFSLLTVCQRGRRGDQAGFAGGGTGVWKRSYRGPSRAR
jgi:hypothetical protein